MLFCDVADGPLYLGFAGLRIVRRSGKAELYP